MEINGHKKHSTLNFVITAIFLAAILAGLVVLTFSLISTANASNNHDLKKALIRMAWLTISLGGLILVLLVWMAIRQIKFRFGIAIERAARTEYQDAWAIAGRRLKVDGDGGADQPDSGAAGDSKEK